MLPIEYMFFNSVLFSMLSALHLSELSSEILGFKF